MLAVDDEVHILEGSTTGRILAVTTGERPLAWVQWADDVEGGWIHQTALELVVGS